MTTSDEGEPPATFYSEREWRIARQLEFLHQWTDAEISVEDFKRKAAYSDYMRLLNEMADSVLAHAKALNKGPADFGFELDEALGVCHAIYDAVQPKRQKDAPFLVWSHVTNLLHRIRTGDDLPLIRRQDLYEATSKYLLLPVRCAPADRILVDALIAVETIEYGQEMFGKESVLSSFIPSRSPFKQKHIFWKFLVGLAMNFALFAGLVAIAAYLGYKGILGSDWAIGISAALVGIFLILAAIQIISLPFAWKQQTKARTLVADLMNEMLSTYGELQDDGPVSVQRVRDVAERAANKGVVWPGALFALLDDMRARNARL